MYGKTGYRCKFGVFGGKMYGKTVLSPIRLCIPLDAYEIGSFLALIVLAYSDGVIPTAFLKCREK